jgi:hypothetical protein
MENKNETMQKSMEKASHGLEKTAESMGETIIAILDKLAGKNQT